MAAPTNAASVKNTLANSEPSTHGTSHTGPTTSPRCIGCDYAHATADANFRRRVINVKPPRAEAKSKSAAGRGVAVGGASSGCKLGDPIVNEPNATVGPL